MRDMNETHGFLHDRERAKPQEIHLQHAEVGERSHRILGHDLVFLASAEWNELVQWTVADDHAGGVDACVAAQALKHGGVVPELPHGRLILNGGG